MSTTSSSPLQLSRRATLLAALALAVLGLAVFTTAASAHFTLSSGKLNLVSGSATGNPPAGSWVTLPSDHSGYFTNTSSTWTGSPDGLYTRITNGGGLTLGADQASSIIGSTTDTFAHLPWTLTNTGTTSLTFDGSHSGTGTRQLISANLTGLKVTYNGATYNVGTTTGGGTDVVHALTGSIHGSTTNPFNPATVTLEWTTDLTQAPFNTFRAHFRLVGTYAP